MFSSSMACFVVFQTSLFWNLKIDILFFLSVVLLLQSKELCLQIIVPSMSFKIHSTHRLPSARMHLGHHLKAVVLHLGYTLESPGEL